MENTITLPANWRDLDLPEAVVAMLDKWQKIADKEMETYKFEWPAKLVETKFAYGGIHYSLKPETFGVPDDLMETLQYGPYITEKYGISLSQDLERTPGFTHVAAYGFLD